MGRHLEHAVNELGVGDVLVAVGVVAVEERPELRLGRVAEVHLGQRGVELLEAEAAGVVLVVVLEPLLDFRGLLLHVRVAGEDLESVAQELLQVVRLVIVGYLGEVVTIIFLHCVEVGHLGYRGARSIMDCPILPKGAQVPFLVKVLAVKACEARSAPVVDRRGPSREIGSIEPGIHMRISLQFMRN